MDKAELVHKSKAKGTTTSKTEPATSSDKAPSNKVVRPGGPLKKVTGITLRFLFCLYVVQLNKQID